MKIRTEIPVEVLRLTGPAFDDPHTTIPRGGGRRPSTPPLYDIFLEVTGQKSSTPIRSFPNLERLDQKQPI